MGFGTSFHKARRKGWENAYLDYETLKLLLTQIETVYEENSGQSGDSLYYNGLSGFSEDAFDMAYDQSRDEKLSLLNRNRKRQRKNRQKESLLQKSNDWRDELFAESDSSAAFASSEYETDDNDDDTEEFSMTKKEDIENYPSLDDANFNFSYDNVQSYGSSTNSLGGFGSGGNIISFDSKGSLENTFGFAVETDPIVKRYNEDEDRDYGNIRGFQSRIGLSRSTGSKVSSPENKKKKGGTTKSKTKRRINRRKVPTSLKKAHGKARAITGRFLGLLRAEIDKVSLFTHSRMGELTDTVGNLRFPSDDMEYGHNHPLSDGGIHASSSSSSDEDLSDNSDSDGKVIDGTFLVQPSYKQRQNRNNGKIDRIRITSETNDDIEIDRERSSKLRQLQTAERIRQSRPIFRSDQVLGEDFMLMSAVDEADAYTAVGIEFLHILRYVVVNAIAIRKLCKKHDRLLRCRMLGGYYHKLKHAIEKDTVPCGASSLQDTTPRRGNVKLQQAYSRVDATATKMSLVPKKSSGTQTANTLIGTYDAKIQNLANSLIANTLTESLELALSEFEVSRQRADRLSMHPKHNHFAFASQESLADLANENLCYGFPMPKTFGLSSAPVKEEKFQHTGAENIDNTSTSSGVSLTRLKFVVSSAQIIREEATLENNSFLEYLSRSALISQGKYFAGEKYGLNGGCSKEVMDFFSSYDPDLALISDTTILQSAMGYEEPQPIIISKDLSQNTSASARFSRSIHSTNASILSANIPHSGNNFVPSDFEKNKRLHLLLGYFAVVCMSNYYIIFPSSPDFWYCQESEESEPTDSCDYGWKNYGYAAMLIGITNFSSLLSMTFQCCRTHQLFSRDSSFTGKMLLLLMCFTSIVGNICYSKGYQQKSLLTAALGRFLIGFASVDLMNKYAMDAFPMKGDIMFHAARKKVYGILGTLLGLVMGSLSLHQHTQQVFHNFVSHIFGDNFVSHILGDTKLKVDAFNIQGYFMALIWFLLILITSCSTLPDHTDEFHVDLKSDISISASVHDHQRSSSVASTDPHDDIAMLIGKSFSHSTRPLTHDQVPKPTIQSTLETINRTYKLVMHNVAIPSMLCVHGLSLFALELLFSSSAIIAQRYFQWKEYSGALLLGLTLFVLPLYFLNSTLTNVASERTMIKNSLVVAAMGAAVLVNYQALYLLALDVDIIFNEKEQGTGQDSEPYNWNFGSFTYCVAMCILFLSFTSIEGLSANLLAKISSAKLNNSIINCGVISTVLACIFKLLGNTFLLIASFSHHVISTDIVNSIALMLMIVCYISFQVVRKNYFFLHG